MRDLPYPFFFFFLKSCTERLSCHDLNICFLVTGSYGYFSKKELKGLLFYQTKGFSNWFLRPKEVSIPRSFWGHLMVILGHYRVIIGSFLVIFGHFWSFLDHMLVIFHHEKFSPELNFALINIWVIRWSFLDHLWSLKIQHRLIRQLNVDKKAHLIR